MTLRGTLHRQRRALLTAVREVRSPQSILHRRLGPPAPESTTFDAHGDATWIVPPAWIDEASRIRVGSDTILLEGSTISTGPAGSVEIGDGCRFGRFTCIVSYDRVSIGARVSASDFATVTDSWGAGEPGLTGPTVVGDGAYLGAGSVICAGVTIGEGAYVGEGAVVDTDVPPRSVVHGNPAVVVRRWSDGAWRSSA